jgi:hypothetical protein
MGIPHSKNSLSLLMVSKDSIERYMRKRKEKSHSFHSSTGARNELMYSRLLYRGVTPYAGKLEEKVPSRNAIETAVQGVYSLSREMNGKCNN